MIRIAITPASYAAIAATLALWTVAVEPERAADGSVHIRDGIRRSPIFFFALKALLASRR
jgi:hypothetical protein